MIIEGLIDVTGLQFGMLLLCLSLGHVLSVGFGAKPLVTNKTINLGKDKFAPKPSGEGEAGRAGRLEKIIRQEQTPIYACLCSRNF